MNMAIDIGSNREVFWDDYLVDTEQTDVPAVQKELTRREAVLTHGEAWEGDGTLYHTVFKDDNLYRMYYNGNWRFDYVTMQKKDNGCHICYAESIDGLTWTKPKLRLHEFQGSFDNNILFDSSVHFDNFFVFKDTNPDCPPEERYKGVGSPIWKTAGHEKTLWCYPSPDGIHFAQETAWLMTRKGAFDTLNTFGWYPQYGKYIGYVRGFHSPGTDHIVGTDWNAAIRDIRRIESDNFRNWSDPVFLDFGDAEDYPLYTNQIMPYYRAPQIQIGFPTRYMERREWTPNFDELCGRELRKARIEVMEPREGLTVNDCLFMFSRDTVHWTRRDEAFIRTGPEQPLNWIYGDAYPAYALYPTPSAIEGADDEMTLLIPDNHKTGRPKVLYRYTIRQDGFMSRRATYKPQRLVTKPLIFSGSALRINFSTSARGYIYVIIRSSDGQEIRSCETFGDSVNRRVGFAGDLAAFSGQPATLEFLMCDADLYSFKFE